MGRFKMSKEKRARLAAHSVKNDHSISTANLADMYGCGHNMAITCLKEAGVWADYQRQHISDRDFAELVNRGFCKAFGSAGVASPARFASQWTGYVQFTR